MRSSIVLAAGLTRLAMASEPQPQPLDPAVADCTTNIVTTNIATTDIVTSVVDGTTITVTVVQVSTLDGSLTTLWPSSSSIIFAPTTTDVTAGPVTGAPSCSAATGTQGSPSSYTTYNWCQCGDIQSDMSTISSDGTVYSVCNGATVGSSPATTTVTVLTASTTNATSTGTGTSSHHSGSSSASASSTGGNSTNSAVGLDKDTVLMGLGLVGAAWAVL